MKGVIEMTIGKICFGVLFIGIALYLVLLTIPWITYANVWAYILGAVAFLLIGAALLFRQK